MTTKYTGEQAFPSVPAFPSSHELMGEKGMSMRDYFAAKALSGLIVNGENFNLPLLTAFCYEVADAMLKARQV